MSIEVRGVAPLFQIFDMPTSIRFYRDVLGFAVVSTSPHLSENPDDVDWAMLRLDETEVMLNTRYERPERPSAPDAARVEAHDDASLYFGCPDVDGAYHHLRDKGVAVKPPHVAHYGMKQLYVKDPDGFVLCFQWRA
jgi:catechol 2,3-dioxygenase-like lactoylglutathione lyase family enzyme